MNKDSTRVIDITIDDLRNLIVEVTKDLKVEIYEMIDSRLNAESDAQEQKNSFEGIEGIAEVLHCSKSKAQRMKRNGMLDGGYVQFGKTIIVNDAKALQQIAASNVEKRKNARRGRRVNYSILTQTL